MSGLQEMVLPPKVTICEVAPRDGFQAEMEWIPTEQKNSNDPRISEKQAFNRWKLHPLCIQGQSRN
ncbi:hypothetical protein GCM10020331_026560 [Ectobacillus funiculus]